MTSLTYTRFELLRAIRNRRFFIFSLVFPALLYVLIAGPQKNDQLGGIPAALYFLAGMVTFGTMNAMLGSGARIAGERSVGWTRQLRITPLKPSSYFITKLLTAYMMASLTIVVLYALGIMDGVSMSLKDWLEMTALILIGLAPFGALGIVLGHLLNIDSIGPVVGGGGAILAMLGGVWFPITGGGFIYHLARLTPTYWLVQAGHITIGGQPWGWMGWTVIASWTAIATLLAVIAYRRDTGKV